MATLDIIDGNGDNNCVFPMTTENNHEMKKRPIPDDYSDDDWHHYRAENLDSLTKMLRSSIPRDELARLNEQDIAELTMLFMSNYNNSNHHDNEGEEEKSHKEESFKRKDNPLIQWTQQRKISKMIQKESESARRIVNSSQSATKVETMKYHDILQNNSLLPFDDSTNKNHEHRNGGENTERKTLKNRVVHAVQNLQRLDATCPTWLRSAVSTIICRRDSNSNDSTETKNDPLGILSTVLPAALLLQSHSNEKGSNDTYVLPPEWDTPFQSDLSYLAYAEASFILRKQRLALLGVLDSNVTISRSQPNGAFGMKYCGNVSFQQQQQPSHQYYMDVVSALDAAKVLLESIVQLKLSYHKPLLGDNKQIKDGGSDKTESNGNTPPSTTLSKLMPRIIRLAHRLNLTTKKVEYNALLYIILSNTSVSSFLPSPPSSSPSISEQRIASQSMAKLSGMNSLDLLDFLDSSRRHMVELLFVPEDEFSNIFNSPFLVVSPEILRVIVGLDLSDEDGFKLSDTAVAEMLEEENEQQQLKKGVVMDNVVGENITNDESAGANSEGKNDDDYDDNDELLKDDLDLEKLLSSVRQETEQTGDGTPSKHTDEKAAVNDEEEEGVTASVSISNIIGKETESSAPTDVGDDESKWSCYQTDLEYLEDQFELVETKMRIRKLEMQDEDDAMLRLGRSGDGTARSPTALLRELHAKLKSICGKINARMAATKAYQSGNGSNGWLPRMEALAQLHGLDEFEKLVILTLVGATISKQVRRFLSGHDGSRSFLGGNTLDVGFLVELGGGSLASQVEARRYFYNQSTLITEGMVRVAEPSLRMRSSSASTTDIMECAVELERRLLDHIVGLDTTLSEIQEGTELYEPQPDTDSVSLPQEQKELILRTVERHELLQKQLAGYGFDNSLSGKTGCVLLFFGKSGTGKTMMAQAVAKHMRKKILSVNVGIIGNDIGGARDTLRFLFREAKIHNAVLFFDECESLFESRDIRSACQSPVTQFLTEIENYEGLVFLATNRAYELDEALFRRITLTVEFKSPDFSLRKRIWKTHLPPKVPLARDVDLDDLAMQFELTGGLIRQAAAGALSLAYSRDPDDAIVTQCDLEEGARQQLRGALMLTESAERVLRSSNGDRERSAIPKASLKDVVLTKHSKDQILQLVHFEKARQLLFSHWGFDGVRHTHTMVGDASIASGTVALFYGPKGCGKALAAEAISYELGRTIREMSASDLLLRWVASNSGSVISASRWLSSFFSSAQESGSVIIVRSAEILFSAEVHRFIESYQPFCLFGAANRGDTSFGVLETFAQQIRRYTGVTILLSNMPLDSQDQGVSFDTNCSGSSNLSGSIRFAVNFEHPDADLRKELWEKLVPQKMPLLAPLDYASLAEKFPLFTGANIRSVIVRTAEVAALCRPRTEKKSTHGNEGGVTQKDFEKAAQMEQHLIGNQKERYQSFSHEGIYN